MKTIIAAAMSVAVVVGAPLAFQHTVLDVLALSGYQSGYNHGISDGRDNCTHSDGCHWYILQPGKGFQFHSRDFVRGYVNGFCSVHGNENAGSDADQASFDCAKGPDSASWLN